MPSSCLAVAGIPCHFLYHYVPVYMPSMTGSTFLVFLMCRFAQFTVVALLVSTITVVITTKHLIVH